MGFWALMLEACNNKGNIDEERMGKAKEKCKNNHYELV